MRILERRILLHRRVHIYYAYGSNPKFIRSRAIQYRYSGTRIDVMYAKLGRHQGNGKMSVVVLLRSLPANQW